MLAKFMSVYTKNTTLGHIKTGVCLMEVTLKTGLSVVNFVNPSLWHHFFSAVMLIVINPGKCSVLEMLSGFLVLSYDRGRYFMVH